MTINFFPSYAIQNEGCFYWGWYPACEIQIFILLPWVVYGILSMKSKVMQAVTVAVGVLAGIAINFFVIWHMNESVYSPGDVKIFYTFLNKPYTKLYAVFFGIGGALVYSSTQ